MKITRNFTLAELIASDTAIVQGFDEQFRPPLEVITNLQVITEMIAQPCRTHFGQPIEISSGYRCLRLNKRVGGSATSDHLLGRALDIKMGNHNKALFDYIVRYCEFDQVKLYPNNRWIHVGFRLGNNRQQVLR